MSHSILVVDDERAIQDALAWCLRTEGEVQTAGNGEEALAAMASHDFDVVIADIIMPGLSGLDLLKKARVFHPRTLVLLITAYATVETAVQALREGACDYIVKPFKLDDLRLRVRRLLECRAMFEESTLFRRTVDCMAAEKTLIGDSAAMRAVLGQVAKIGPAVSSVLITGESGTGKELVAQAIHAASPRRGQPFVPINCGAIPEPLLESQLFGHIKGAFTSAMQANAGLFCAGDHGTVFLDEIGEMPVHLQVKLLRVIEEKQVWAVGSTKPVQVDIRIIASTNRELGKEVEAGRFREDLFYRLNVVQIVLPPLRERREDIPVLVDHFVHRFNAKLSRKVLGVDRDVLRVLMTHSWKGNVRELEHVLERAMLLGEGELITPRDLPPALVASAGEGALSDALRQVTRQIERQHIVTVLARTRSDKREAARVLGISLASLYRKIGELDIKAEK